MTAPAPNERSPAVFLDRDGTIMREVEYCGDPNQVQVFAGTSEVLRRLKASGFKIIVVTNQSGIGRGYFTREAYHAVQREVDRQVGAGLIDAIYFCPDKPDAGCRCRKPQPGMILDAERDHNIDLTRSFLIGDKPLDAECGRNAGLRTILVRTGKELPEECAEADWIAQDLPEAAEIIVRHAI